MISDSEALLSNTQGNCPTPDPLPDTVVISPTDGPPVKEGKPSNRDGDALMHTSVEEQVYGKILNQRAPLLELINSHLSKKDNGCWEVYGDKFVWIRHIANLRIGKWAIPVLKIRYLLATGLYENNLANLCANEKCCNPEHYAPRFSDAAKKARLKLNTFPLDDHMLWCGSTTNAGYAKTTFGGIPIYVHRLAYQLFIGPIPEGKEIGHICGIRHCCNPEHLIAQTRAENMAQMALDGRARGPRATGEATRNSRLRISDVKQIRICKAQGERTKNLASRFGISTQYTNKIIRGDVWPQVPNYDADGNGIPFISTEVAHNPGSIPIRSKYNINRSSQKPHPSFQKAPAPVVDEINILPLSKKDKGLGNPEKQPADVLAKIYDRSRKDSAGHLIWTGRIHKSNDVPILKIGRKPAIYPHRVLFAEKFGRPKKLFKICEIPYCIHPDCYSPKKPYQKVADQLRGKFFRDGKCIITNTCRDKDGYPQISQGGTKVSVIRARTLEKDGSIPKGHHVRHTCGNPSCIRFSHLKVGTAKQNAQDRVEKRKLNPEMPLPKGQLHANSDLTDQDYLDIRKMHDECFTTTQIMAKYEISRSEVQKIVSREFRPWVGITYKQCDWYKGWGRCLCRAGCCVYGEAARKPLMVQRQTG